MKWGLKGRSLVLFTTDETQLHDSLDIKFKGLYLIRDNALRNFPAQVRHRELNTEVLWEREVVETHTLLPSRDRSALSTALKPLVVDGTNFGFSGFSCAVIPPGIDVRNQTRKERTTSTPEIEVCVLLGISSSG
jgi:hypothetical protein